jgi:hypothetical protein
VATAVSWGVAAVGLAGAVVWTAAGVTAPQAAGASAVAADIDIRIREASAGTQARAETLAQLPRLAVAVATDERTFRDLTADELAFRPRPDEHIEIAQIPLARRGGPEPASRSLLRLPDDRLPLPMTSTGRHVVIGGGGLHAVAFEPVEVRVRAHELRGAIAVARRIDLSPFASRLAALGLSGRIDLASGSFPLGGTDVRSGGVSRVVLGSVPAGRATLVLTGIVAPPSRRRFIGPIALMAVSAVAARRLRRRKPLGARAKPRLLGGVTSPETGGATGGAGLGDVAALLDTEWTVAPPVHVLAVPPGAAPHGIVPPPGRADTPTPVVGIAVVPSSKAMSEAALDEVIDDGPEQTVRRPSIGIAELYDDPVGPGSARRGSPRAKPDRSHADANTLPANLFETSDVPLPPSPPTQPDDRLEREYRALYTEFVTMRRTCREPPCTVNADRFVLLLRHQRDELIRKYGARDVAFRLAFQNGKAAIRFNPAG